MLESLIDDQHNLCLTLPALLLRDIPFAASIILSFPEAIRLRKTLQDKNEKEARDYASLLSGYLPDNSNSDALLRSMLEGKVVGEEGLIAIVSAAGTSLISAVVSVDGVHPVFNKKANLSGSPRMYRITSATQLIFHRKEQCQVFADIGNSLWPVSFLHKTNSP